MSSMPHVIRFLPFERGLATILPTSFPTGRARNAYLSQHRICYINIFFPTGERISISMFGRESAIEVIESYLGKMDLNKLQPQSGFVTLAQLKEKVLQSLRQFELISE
jgi:hypothetical protein